MTHFMSIFQLSATFNGGNAPAYWWRGIKQKTASLSAVRRGSAWIEEFGAIYPRLCESPLLGYTLASLTGQTDSTQEEPPETRRSEKTKLARWENLSKPNRNVSTANKSIIPQSRTLASIQQAMVKRGAFKTVPANSSTGSSARALLQMKTRTDRLLLSKLAGGEPVFDRTTQKQPLSFSTERKRSETFFLSDAENATIQQHWLDRMVQRVKKTGIQEQMDTTGTTKLTQDNAQISDYSPSLQEQWAMPLNGTSVSLNLLNQLVQENSSGGEGNSESTQAQSPTQARTLKKYSFEKSNNSSKRLDDWANSDNKLESRSAQPMTVPTSYKFFAPEFSVNGQAGHEEDKTKSSTPTIPPNVMPSLPNLLAPQRVGTQPLPVAAATVHRGAHEEMKATDDLDVLAAKIKQILDEQARRYGIDV